MSDAVKSDAVKAETVYIGDEQIQAYLARPLDPRPYPGVVVIHHMPGYDEQTKEMVRKFAVHGYAAICPNLYWRQAPDAAPEDAWTRLRLASRRRASRCVTGSPGSTARSWACSARTTGIRRRTRCPAPQS